MSNNPSPNSESATITRNELRKDGREPYRSVLIELPNGDEYTCNFPAESDEAEILSTLLAHWRII